MENRDTLGEYVTTKQASKLLGLTQRRVGQLVDEGELKAEKVANRLLVLRQSVYDYLARKAA